MRVAIPTDDKIVVSNDPRESGYFKVVTLKGEEIVNEEYRSNPLRRDGLKSPLTRREVDAVITLLADCDALIGGTCENDLINSNIPHFLDTVITNQSIITCAVLEYNNRILYNERNTCCSP